MPKPRLYAVAKYDRSAKARWLLTELGVDFEMRWLDREAKENESPEFLRLNPMGRVPVLQLGDRAIFESGAICSHLADLYPGRGLAPAPGSAERAEHEQWMYFAASTLENFQARIMVIEDIPAGELQAAKLGALQSDFRDALEALDRALARGSFLVGSRFTAADVCVSYQLYWCRLWPELDGETAAFPRVVEYMKRMQSMPSAVKSEAFSYPG